MTTKLRSRSAAALVVFGGTVLLLAAAACSSDGSGGGEPSTENVADPAPRVPVATHEELNVPESSDPNSPFSSEVFRNGLLAYRRPHEKGACASCHSPDAFDLAFFNYSDSTILRRAFGIRASVEDAHAIVAMVHEQRERHGITPVDPTRYSPLQPGGEVLPGATSFETEQAFWDQLVGMGHPYATFDRIDSREEAHAALETIAGFDLRLVRVGFEFPRWTDDGIRGPEHHSINDWIPEFPSHPKEGRVLEWYALQNAYIENPVPETLWAMYDVRTELTDNLNLFPYVTEEHDGSSIHQTFGTDMFGAVLIGQHMLRHGTFSRPDTGFRDIEGYATPHATNDPFVKEWRDRTKPRVERFWEVGASFGSGGHPFPSWEEWPDFIVEKDPGYELGQHRDVRTKVARSWFWMGYMMDPHLKLTAAGNRAEYFPAHLNRDGYLIHEAFVGSTMVAALVYARDNRWQRQNWLFDHGNAVALFGDGLGGFSWLYRREHLEPGNGHTYETYPADLAEKLRVFQLNDLRARIYAALGSLEEGHVVTSLDSKLENLAEYEALLTEHEDPALLPQLLADIAKLRVLFEGATEVNQSGINTDDFSDRSHVGRTEGEASHIPLGIPEEAYAPRPESPLGPVYEAKCSGCHGLDGEGRGPGGELAGHKNEQSGYPPLRGYPDYATFVRYVRDGSSRTFIPMPWFDATQVSDEDLQAIFAGLQ